MPIQILDDFLPDDDFKSIQKFFMTGHIPWKFTDKVTGTEKSEDAFQFTHMFFDAHPYYVLNFLSLADCKPIRSILGELDPYILLRIKANLRTKTPKPIQSDFHTDLKTSNYTTSIYYLNSNNGYTLFEDGMKVPSIANRMITFNGDMRHCGVSCTDQQTRVVLNINYLPTHGSNRKTSYNDE